MDTATNTDEEVAPKLYELGFLVKEEGGAAGVLDLVRQHRGEITQEGGVRNVALSYPIGKQTSAFFGFVHFRATPAAVKALEGDLTRTGVALRTIIVTLPVFRARPERIDDRPLYGRSEAQAAPRPATDRKPDAVPLSNEAIERKIEEILK